MKLAICVPFTGHDLNLQARGHTDICNDCLRRADSRKNEKQAWQFVPVFKDACPSKVTGAAK